MKTTFIVIAFFAFLAPTLIAEPIPKLLKTISVKRPAFLSLQEGDLYISSFRVFGKDGLAVIKEIGDKLSGQQEIKPLWLNRTIVWPNQCVRAPNGLFSNSLLVAGGFLVPHKNTGAITVLSLSDPSVTCEISKPKKGWFYHETQCVDMDGDGDLDVLTARAKVPMIGEKKGELIWFENGNQWSEHYLTAGPDVHFVFLDLNDDGNKELISTEFFSKRLMLYSFVNGKARKRLIDGRLGSAFDLEVVDLNGDKKLDLLATNHEGDDSAAVFAYEIPQDIWQGRWSRHTILAGIKTLQPGLNQASPGQAIHFQINEKSPLKKPAILVSGDGSQKAHLLLPNSSSHLDWTYSESVITHTKCTVGQCAVGDVNGDGWAEVFVPAFDNDSIEVFSFAP